MFSISGLLLIRLFQETPTGLVVLPDADECGTEVLAAARATFSGHERPSSPEFWLGAGLSARSRCDRRTAKALVGVHPPWRGCQHLVVC